MMFYISLLLAGTGKSSFVCAMCVGLAGGTNVSLLAAFIHEHVCTHLVLLDAVTRSCWAEQTMSRNSSGVAKSGAL